MAFSDDDDRAVYADYHQREIETRDRKIKELEEDLKFLTEAHKQTVAELASVNQPDLPSGPRRILWTMVLQHETLNWQTDEIAPTIEDVITGAGLDRNNFRLANIVMAMDVVTGTTRILKNRYGATGRVQGDRR